VGGDCCGHVGGRESVDVDGIISHLGVEPVTLLLHRPQDRFGVVAEERSRRVSSDSGGQGRGLGS
jgi:hypothetical protein